MHDVMTWCRKRMSDEMASTDDYWKMTYCANPSLERKIMILTNHKLINIYYYYPSVVSTHRIIRVPTYVLPSDVV